MQKPAVSGCNHKQPKDRDMQPEHNSTEEMDVLSMRRRQMRSPLHITRKLQWTDKTLKIIRKRREEVKKVAYKHEGECWDFHDEKMMVVMSIMRDMKHLTSLGCITLCFRECFLLTDTGISSVGNCLSVLTSLRSINLYLEGWHNITDAGMNFLDGSLRYLTLLTSINFNFAKCYFFTDIGMRYLRDGLRYLTSLTSISLDFTECYNITNDGLSSISDCLRYLASLNNIHLNFLWCRVLLEAKEKVWKDLKSTLKFLKHIQIK